MPARPTWYVGRAGISMALDATAGGAAWLVTVVAGAGAGKTTALGAWATERRARWYSLRPDDADLSAMLSWLADAARIPGWSDALPAELPVAAGGDTAEQARADALASLLAIAVDHAQPTGGVRPVTVVLDGFEVLPADEPDRTVCRGARPARAAGATSGRGVAGRDAVRGRPASGDRPPDRARRG